MSTEDERRSRTTYSLRNVPRQDYHRLIRGPIISRDQYFEGETLSSTTDEEGATRAETEESETEPEEAIRQEEEERENQLEEEEEGMERLAEILGELTRLQGEQQQRHDESRRQQNEEHREQIREMQEQHQQQLEAMRETLLEQRPADSNLKIAPYQESEDIQDFLEAFEGIMKLQKVKDADWVLRLTPLLRGKARAVCTDLGPTKQYAEVKEAILNHHSINPERCRRQFRELQWTRGKDPSEWVAKGNKLMRRWLKPADGIDKILEQIAVEQFLNGLPQEVRVWVASQNPTTSAEVAALLESYDSAHARPVKTGTCNPQQDQKHTPRSSNWKRSNGTKPTPPKEKKKSLADIVCFKCNKKGHVARDCPEKTYRVREETERRRLRGEGTVNGQGVKRIQIDTGASRTIVDKRFVRAEDLKKDKIRVTFGNQSSGEYPLANVRIIFDNEEYCVEAAVVENLAEDVLLGQDVPLHKHMVKRLSKEEQLELLRQLKKDNEDQAEKSVEGEILMAKTRAMRKKEQRTTSSERTRSTTSEEQQRTTSSERERSTTSEEQQRTTSSERKRSTTSEEQQRTTSSERKRSTTSEEQQRTTSSEGKRSTTSEEQQRTTSSERKRSTTSEEQQRTTSSERKRSTTSEEQQRTTSSEGKRSTTSEEQ